jgi:hypothetical protein
MASTRHEYTGVIREIGPIEEVGANKFRKRVIVVCDESDKYPQEIPFEMVKDKCELADQYKVGQTVTVSYNLRGREYNGRRYLSAQAWAIAHHGEVPAGVAEGAPKAEASNGDDAIPF